MPTADTHLGTESAITTHTTTGTMSKGRQHSEKESQKHIQLHHKSTDRKGKKRGTRREKKKIKRIGKSQKTRAVRTKFETGIQRGLENRDMQGRRLRSFQDLPNREGITDRGTLNGSRWRGGLGERSTH